jgi:hypothetical protein
MLDPKYCYLLSQVKTKPSKPQPVVQKPCTKPEDDKPISMADAFNTFTPLTYVSNKFN